MCNRSDQSQQRYSAEMIYWCNKLFVTSVVHPGKFLSSWFSIRKLKAKCFISACFDPNHDVFCVALWVLYVHLLVSCWGQVTASTQDCEDFQSISGLVGFSVHSEHCCVATTSDPLGFSILIQLSPSSSRVSFHQGRYRLT